MQQGFKKTKKKEKRKKKRYKNKFFKLFALKFEILETGKKEDK